MRKDFIFVSESVTRGHPDKLCDQISDAIVDAYLTEDVTARIGAECAVSSGIIFISTHYRSAANVDVTETARRVVREAGYVSGKFNAEDCAILTSISELEELAQTPEPAGADTGASALCAPAQQPATVFGYARRDTDTLMPLPVTLAHALARGFDAARGADKLSEISPDAKMQVSIEYRNRKPARIHSLSVIASADPAGSATNLESRIRNLVIEPAVAGLQVDLDETTRIHIGTKTSFMAGGPGFHSGLTGRKTAVDTYGEFARHSGSALSGKDPTRIDRIGAYAARHAAKNIVAAGLADECEVQLSYSIGEEAPVSLNVDTFGTSQPGDDELAALVSRVFDFRPGAILDNFGIRDRFAAGEESFFLPLASYGHMGREDLGVPWEANDRTQDLLRG